MQASRAWLLDLIFCVAVALAGGCGGPTDSLAEGGDVGDGGDGGGGSGSATQDEVILGLRMLSRDGAGNVTGWQDTLAKTTLDGTTVEELPASGDYMSDPTWSPGGKCVAFAGGPLTYDHDLYRTCEGGTLAQTANAPVRLTHFVDDDITVLETAWNPANVGEIACGLYATDAMTGDDEYWIVVVDADTGATLRELTPRAGGRAQSPAWSPDGAAIAYTDDEGLKSVLADGSGAPRLLAAGFVFQPSWSPDGTRIAYAEGFPQRLWRLDPRDAAPVPVPVTTEAGPWSDAMPAWTSDSNRIVFVRFFDDDSPARLYLASADGDGTATELPAMAALTEDEIATRPQPYVPQGS